MSCDSHQLVEGKVLDELQNSCVTFSRIWFETHGGLKYTEITYYYPLYM